MSNLYQRSYPTPEDAECEELMDKFLQCEKSSIVISETVCQKEKDAYLACREKYKELNKERSYQMMQQTKNLYFTTGSMPLVVLNSNREKK